MSEILNPINQPLTNPDTHVCRTGRFPQLDLFGITIDNVTMEEALQEIWSWFDCGGKHYLTTPNVDHIVRLHKDKEFMNIYEGASLVIADGMPIVWASRLLGKPLKGRVAGSDLFPQLCRLAAFDGKGVFFLGSMPGVAEKAAENLKKRYPGFKLAGCYSPPFGFEKNPQENEKIIKMINDSRAPILFVALGAPKQEKWTYRYMHALNIKAAFCVGASIDFEAGVVKRAPAWVGQIGLEWLWRLFSDPKRLWRRYLVEDSAFISIFLKEWWKGFKSPKK